MFISCIILQSGLISIYTITTIRHHKASVKLLVKKHLKDGQSDSKLTLFSQRQLQHAKWEHSKEFFLGDEKYDVVRVTDSAGTRIYHCVNDKIEQELYGKLDKDQERNSVLEETIKKICFQLSAIRHSLPVTTEKTIYAEYYPDQYTYGFSYAHFRPPTSLA